MFMCKLRPVGDDTADCACVRKFRAVRVVRTYVRVRVRASRVVHVHTYNVHACACMWFMSRSKTSLMDREEETRDQLARPTYRWIFSSAAISRALLRLWCSTLLATVLINSDSDEDCVEIQVCKRLCAS